VGKTSGGEFLDGGSIGTLGSLSADGRYVVFESDATNLPGRDDVADVYRHDVQTGITRLISRTTAGAPADSDSDTASISANGRFVAFESNADNLGGAPGFKDVFLSDVQTGVTRLISRSTAGAKGNGDSFYASVSGDGRFVAFTSRSDNFSTLDDNAVSNCFVRGPLS
jgi:Tol biopolymer transport system component